ncbi:MAG: hypothetical protein RR623_08125 [Bacilli bacterium]
MKKIIYILCILLLVGCVNSSKPSSPSSFVANTKQETQDIEDLLLNGNYFNYFSYDETHISYELEEDTLLVYVNKMKFIFQPNDKVIFDYYSPSITLSYKTDDDTENIGYISTHYWYDESLNCFNIDSLFSTKSFQTYEIAHSIKDEDTIRIEYNQDLNLPGDVLQQLLAISKQQISDIENIISELNQLNDLIALVLNSNDEYHKLSQAEKYSTLEISKHDFDDNRSLIYFPSYTVDSKVYLINNEFIDAIQIDKPEYTAAAYFLYIHNENEITLEETYDILFNFHATPYGDMPIYTNQYFFERAPFISFDLDTINTFRNDILNQDSVSINETKKLPNGLVQIKEDKTVISLEGFFDNSGIIYGILYEEISQDNHQISALVTPYFIYTLKTPNGDYYYSNLSDCYGNIISNEITSFGKIYEFADSKKDNLVTWNVSMNKNDGDVYKISSFTKMK